jgi:hypothetical protein
METKNCIMSKIQFFCGANVRPDRHESKGQLPNTVREGNRNLSREAWESHGFNEVEPWEDVNK